ncbi:MAG: type IV pilus twitching motility protein PilT [Elusimicrobiaceae bacterium]|nr:type IV pilus twitching motility protein PilT [Elusimicrobiaceae bacterium]
MNMVEVLTKAVKLGASDIHIVIGKPPMMRLHGEILPVPDFPEISAEDAKNTIYSVLFENQRMIFEREWELDCSFGVAGLSRFRINVFMQTHGVEAVMRVIPSKIPTPEEIGLSKSIKELAGLDKGLVLVTGPTGSGKSTTLAALLDTINRTEARNILTVEDPIEFSYTNNKSVFRQREVGQQTKSFAAALRSALRQDPDVILVGEMRDLETIQLAITAAETGHLCFGTLHTQDSASTVDRIIDVFPPHQQAQIRVQLANSLKAVVSQVLLPKAEGTGRIAARELMVVTPAISNLIREGKTHMIYNAIETGVNYGMVSMDKALAHMVSEQLVTREEAEPRVHSMESFRQLLGENPGSGANRPAGKYSGSMADAGSMLDD